MLRPVLVAALAATVAAADPKPPSAAEVEALIDGAQRFILAQATPDGPFAPGAKFVLGITGIAAEALAAEPRAVVKTDPRLAKAIEYVSSFRQPDGGVYNPAEGLGNYNTSIALLLWTTTGTADQTWITGAQNYLFGVQNTVEGSPNHGGMGYGSKGAGWEDLSNTSWAIAALRASGVPASDPRMQSALAFLERCQDLGSVNSLPWVRNTGGAVYGPHTSMAGGSWDRQPVAEGAEPPRLLPYGSMTYALISTYVVLDLKPEDPRVAAALDWVKSHWTFERNPGMVNSEQRPNADQQGLFYYYRMAAKTMEQIQAKTITLPDGRVADWRREVFDAVAARAKREGDQVYWLNEQDRWAEGMPVLTTSYVLRSLKGIRAALD